MYGSWFHPFTSSYTASRGYHCAISYSGPSCPIRPPPCAGTLKCHFAEMSTDPPGAIAESRSTLSVVPNRVRFTSLPRIVIDSSRGALLKPWHEKSKLVPRNTSGGWLRTLVMLFGSHRFCSTNSQRYGSD